MKEVLSILLVGILVFSGVGTLGLANEHSIININNEARPELIIDVSGGFGIKLNIRNVGDADATDVNYYIGIFGGTPMSKNTDIQPLDNISPGESVKVKFRFLGFGIGLFEDIPVIHAKVWCHEEELYKTNVNALILFNLIILR